MTDTKLSSAKFLTHVHDIGKEVQWDFMHGLMENAIYGGRVDNTFDMRVLVSYLLQYFDAGLLSGSGRARSGKRLVANISLPQSTNIKVRQLLKVV